MTEPSKYMLKLYITGATHHSMQAVKNIKQICEDYLVDRYDLHIIDVYQQPSLAEENQIIAVPTLVKISPEPIRRVVGDMSDTSKILSVLGIRQEQN